jgi:hypothetical protein
MLDLKQPSPQLGTTHRTCLTETKFSEGASDFRFHYRRLFLIYLAG